MNKLNNKSDTYYQILKAAKHKFLAKGYEKASMRAIAGQVGITATALYRHFKDKEDIFRVLVQPLLDELCASAEEGMAKVLLIFKERNPDEFWSYNTEKFAVMFEYIYDNIDELQLLAVFSDGTCFQNFRKELIEQEVAEYLLICEYAANSGISVKYVDSKNLRLIIGGFISMLFDLMAQNYTREEARQRSLVIFAFIQGGLCRILGF